MRKTLFLVLLFLATVVSCDNFTPDTPDPGTPVQIIDFPLQKALHSIDGLTIIGPSTNLVPGYSESYRLTITQPIDHNHPEVGTFEQLFSISFKGFDKPVVVETDGYIWLLGMPSCLAQDLDANYVEVEYRCFGQSRIPGNEDWKYLDDWQAASDHHELVKTLKKIFPGKFIATGLSKGGIAATIFRYFYPEDVDLTVPFCAPFCLSQTDTRLTDYLYYAEDSKELREKYLALDRIAFEHSDEFCEKFAVDFDMPADMPKSQLRDKMINAVLEGQFTKFGSDFPFDWEKRFPDPDDLSAVYHFLLIDRSIPSDPKTYDEALKGNYPYYVQAAKSLGYYKYSTEPFKQYVDDISFGLKTNLFARDEHALSEYDGGALMKSIVYDFVPNNSKYPMVFVYGGRDSWTGASVDPNNLGPAVTMIVEPGGTHSDKYSDFKTKAEIQKAVRSALGE